MTEVMLGEIARPPTNELLGCRESYSLAAGLSLGFIALGRGCDAAGLADLHVEDTLGAYIHGHAPVPNVLYANTSRGAPTFCGGSSRGSSIAARCYRIREGPRVNVDVTAAGATLALGLIFAKTGNASVAAQLEVPRTTHALHCIRPDLILLRVLARNLILWHDIRPTSVWLESQLTLSADEVNSLVWGGVGRLLGLIALNDREVACYPHRPRTTSQSRCALPVMSCLPAPPDHPKHQSDISGPRGLVWRSRRRPNFHAGPRELRGGCLPRSRFPLCGLCLSTCSGDIVWSDPKVRRDAHRSRCGQHLD